MPLLFSYGTLQDEDVQLSTFGRRLVGTHDVLIGFEQTLKRVEDQDFVEISGKAEHKILRHTGQDDSRLDGVVFEVTEQELEIADDYEPDPWQRVLVKLASGKRAWVYVDSSNTPPQQ